MVQTMDELRALTQRGLNRIHELTENLTAVREREVSPDGIVEVEVDGSGALLDLRFTREIADLSPAQFERLIVDTARSAAVRAFTRRADLITEYNSEAAG